MSNKVEVTIDSITSYIKEGNNESKMTQKIGKDGRMHIIYEHKQDDGKEILIERKEYIF